MCLGLVLALYWYVTKNFNRYKDLGVPFIPGSFPLGSFNFLSGKHFDVLTQEACAQFENEKFFGCFLFGKPVVTINDPELLKQIQVKDFDHFVDRIGPIMSDKFLKGGETDEILRRGLSSLSGDEWKDARSTFTPIFTSGKMKNMFKFIKLMASNLIEDLETKADQGEEFELKTLFGKFSLDAIASAAFGVNAESFRDDKTPFVKNAAALFHQGLLKITGFALRLIPGVPDLFQKLNISTMNPTEVRFFRDIILQTIKLRRQTGERRNDLIDLMVDALNDDVEDADEGETDQYEEDMKMNHKKKKHLDETAIVGTAIVLITAGYDTTAITLSFLTYELAINPDVQRRLQEEVDEAFEDAGGELPDYSTIQGLPLLEMVILETLRRHPPLGNNMRMASKEYQLPESNVVLKKGDGILYSSRFLHYHPDHWSHPEEFYPEHFSKEEKSSRSPYAFQAFGQGPRACIGMRFALLEVKVAIMMMLRQFDVESGSKTKVPLELDPNNDTAFPVGGLWATIKKRQSTE